MIEQINRSVDWCLEHPGPESERSLLSYAALDLSLGHVLRDRRRDAEWYESDARKAITKALPSSGSLALLDTTTLLNGLRLLDPEYQINDLHVGAIFDLATFISAYVLEDNLVFLDNRERIPTMVRKLLQGLSTTALPWGGEDDFSIIIENAWGEAERYTPELFCSPRWKGKFIKHWTQIAGEPVGPDALNWPADYRKYFSSVDSHAVESAILKQVPIKSASGPYSLGMGLTKDFVTESSIRAVFYSLLANTFGATYYAGSFRSRLRDSICEVTAESVTDNSIRLLHFLNSKFQEEIGEGDLTRSEVPMPFLLSAALSGVTNCTELCERIAAMRAHALPLRKRKSELELALRNQDRPMVKALFRAVTKEASSLADANLTMGNGIISKIILSPGGARASFGALGKLLLSLSKLPDNVKTVLSQRLARPELWVLTRLAAQAQQTINCLDPLYKLMQTKGLRLGATDRDLNLQLLKRLAS